jgi:FkbM family methyltransferase
MIKELKIFGKPITLTMRNDGDLAIANELFLDRQYRHCEPAIKAAKHSIIDVGGHLGFFSLLAGLLNTKTPIYTYEPHIGNFELLKENLKLNRIKNVSPKQTAVSDQAGDIKLQISAEDLNHSIVHAIEPTGETQTVHATTLEKIFQKNRIVKCDLLKLDCEGSEFKIISNSPKEVFKKIDNIFLEYHDWAGAGHSSELKQTLINLGYKVEQYPNHKMKELGFMWCKK